VSRGRRPLLLAAAAAVAAAATAGCAERPDVVIGSKKFTESVLLGDLGAQLVDQTGLSVGHQRELGGTRLVWSALLAGEIDAYPEYTGTLRQEILSGEDVAEDEGLARALAARGIAMTAPLGFSDSYALGMREPVAESLGIRTLSDLARHPQVVIGLSHEFLDREDGWPAVRKAYGMPHRGISGLDHDLAYRALESGSIQVTDIYTTDPQIRHYNLRVLEDDRGAFPPYDAMFLYRADLEERAPEAVAALRRLEGRISTDEMIEMNGRAMLDRVAEPRVAADFLLRELDITATVTTVGRASRIWARTLEHLFLVALSLLAAVLVSVPLGILCARRPRVGQVVLAAVEAVQTIPSMALLVLFVPLLGIGALPALAAMFLYSLLPIVRSTATGLLDVPPGLRESAAALGLPSRARLRLVELPMASRAILAGIKTSAVWNVATATIGALVGARGYGQPILSGIRLDDTSLILEGAIPAAVMALALRGVFEIVERLVVPRGLRLKPAA
jgi:osmoprotectant transport system permease protein